jgi:hypothetical protein
MLILLFLLTTLGWASEQTLIYDLSIDGAVVGERKVTIRYMPPIEGVAGASRLIQSWFDVDTRIAGQQVVIQSRSSARASDSDSSFAMSIAENGVVREIQGQRQWDGVWQVVAIEHGERKTWKHRRTEVTLSSMDFLDPSRHKLMTLDTQAGVLVAETGQVVQGAVSELGDKELWVNGKIVLVEEWGWSPDMGQVVMSWNQEGLLLAYSVSFMGKTLDAVVREVPPTRSYGNIDLSTVSDDVEVEEEEL